MTFCAQVLCCAFLFIPTIFLYSVFTGKKNPEINKMKKKKEKKKTKLFILKSYVLSFLWKCRESVILKKFQRDKKVLSCSPNK